MRTYLIRRLVQTIPVIVIVALLVFLLLHLAPGDPVRLMSDRMTSAEDLERIRQRLGLDQPLPVQFVRWASGVLQGDFGRSIRTDLPVMSEIASRYPNTIRLSVASILLATAVGIPLGVAASIHRGRALDAVTMVSSVFGMSIPPFWLGLVLILVFSVYLPWFPSGGGSSPAHLVLPTLSLAAASTALIARMTRSSMLEVLLQDYIRTARAKGLDERVVIYRHALRNALVPTVTVIGLQFGTLLAGAVVTEVVFAWPGIGWLLVQSILNRDFPLVQGGLLVASLTFTVVNLVVDMAYAFLDPHIRYD